MLAHFKPFSPTNTLLKPTETFEDVFQSYCFNKFSKQVMLNREAIHECQDARDAEHIKK